MSPEILWRILIAGIIILLSVMGYNMFNRWLLARVRLHRLGIETAQPGRLVLVYFTMPSCAPCKTIQQPAIQRLLEKMGDRVRVIEFDASARPEIAAQWGVLSVPTTYILDQQGTPRFVNHGVATYEQLSRQMASLSSGV